MLVLEAEGWIVTFNFTLFLLSFNLKKPVFQLKSKETILPACDNPRGHSSRNRGVTWSSVLLYPYPNFFRGREGFLPVQESLVPQGLEGGGRLVAHLGVCEGYWITFSVNLVL